MSVSYHINYQTLYRSPTALSARGPANVRCLWDVSSLDRQMKINKKNYKQKNKKTKKTKKILRETSLPCDENDLTKLLNLVRQKTFFFLSDHVYPCGWEFTGARPPIASSCFKHYRKCLEFLSIKIEKGERVSAIASDLVATASTNIRRDEAMAWCQIWYVTLSDYRFCR